MQIYFKDVKSKAKNFHSFHSDSKTFYPLIFNSSELIYNYLSERNRLIDIPRLYSTLIAKENFSRHLSLFFIPDHILGKLDTKGDSTDE